MSVCVCLLLDYLLYRCILAEDKCLFGTITSCFLDFVCGFAKVFELWLFLLTTKALLLATLFSMVVQSNPKVYVGKQDKSYTECKIK